MGAGFAIAMRDLEIRGAGNILGTEQSGHISAVGYELYCSLLEQTVRRLRRLPPKVSVDVDLDLLVEAYIPRSYVPDMRLKIDLYRRLARVSDRKREHWAAALLLGAAPLAFLAGVVGSRSLRLEGYYWTRWSDPAAIVLTAVFALGLGVALAARFPAARLKVALAAVAALGLLSALPGWVKYCLDIPIAG